LKFTGHKGGGEGVYFQPVEILKKLEIYITIIDTGTRNREE